MPDSYAPAGCPNCWVSTLRDIEREIQSSCSPTQQFGSAAKSLFQLSEGYVNFNHGSFGATPKVVRSAQEKWTTLAESQPDNWFRTGYRDVIERARAELAAYVGAASAGDVVLVENASSGVNAVLRSLRFPAGASIVFLSFAYAMVKNTIAYLVQRDGVAAVEVEIPYPITGPESILDPLRRALDALPAGSAKLLCVSHITSVPAIVLPVREIAAEARRRGLRVLVDGAHALGQIPVNVTDIGADFYVGNGHKWLYSPKGSAFLWTSPAAQSLVVPTVISSSGKTDYVGEFAYTGTRDYTAFATVLAAFEFRRALGERRIMQYPRDLARDGGALLARAWGTEVLQPPGLTGSMTNVRLPTDDAAAARGLADALLARYGTYIVVFSWYDRQWCRLSAQVYLDIGDFERLAERVLLLLLAGGNSDKTPGAVAVTVANETVARL